MNEHTSVSLLSVLSVYSKLRREGKEPAQVLEELQPMINQLGTNDRRELDKGISDWEEKRGKQVLKEAEVVDLGPWGKSPVTSSASTNLGSGQSSSATEVLLRPIRSSENCPNCGKHNDFEEPICKYCGALLRALPSSQPESRDASWFGKDSMLQLIIKGAAKPLEISVHNNITIGRHTPNSAPTDVNLTPYKADELGVSRMHASIKWQNDTLVLSDMHSTNHTFVNGQRLGGFEGRVLRHGDEVYFGSLGLTVAFKHADVPSQQA